VIGNHLTTRGGPKRDAWLRSQFHLTTLDKFTNSLNRLIALRNETGSKLPLVLPVFPFIQGDVYTRILSTISHTHRIGKQQFIQNHLN
jgi:hypothetical protein